MTKTKTPIYPEDFIEKINSCNDKIIELATNKTSPLGLIKLKILYYEREIEKAEEVLESYRKLEDSITSQEIYS